MTPRDWSAVPYALALAAVGFAYVVDPAPAQPRLPRVTAPSCPLPVGQQVKAVKAFGEMMPVFRHPRCFNCHGGIDIKSERQHKGASQVDTELDPRGFLTLDQRREIGQICGDCHDNIRGTNPRLDGWMVPPAPMYFTDKDDEQICMAMKQFETTGHEFVDHIEFDHHEIQFIEAGFAGDRALGPDGLAENRLVAEPPPGTQADLTTKARKWVDLVGEGYTASPECGCVMPKIRLEIHHDWSLTVPRGLPSRQSSEEQFEVSLLPVGESKPGIYQGQHSLKRVVHMTLPAQCRGGASVQERWVLYAKLDPESGAVHVWHVRFDDEPVGEILCQPGNARMGIDPGVLAGELGAGETVIPPDSTSKTLVGASVRGGHETLTFTVLDVSERGR